MELEEASKRTRSNAIRNEKRRGRLFGSYFPDRDRPWIEVYVDNLCERFGRNVLDSARGREVAISMCLFHELGHHISRWIQGRRHPTESDAQRWEKRLSDEILDPALFDLPSGAKIDQ